MGVVWYIVIVLTIVLIVVGAVVLSKKFIRLEERNIYGASNEEVFHLKNEGKSVDEIVSKIEELGRDKPIPFDIRGRLE